MIFPNTQGFIGPKNNFKRIAYRDNNYKNDYHLQNCNSIEFDCSQLEGGRCLYHSTLYTGTTPQITILCGTNDCYNTTIDSDININLIYEFESPSLWKLGFNIICGSSSNVLCISQFKIHFMNTTCGINTDNLLDCPFLFSPSPTETTESPTTAIPTLSPTTAPSQPPTISPTLSPSSSPTNTDEYSHVVDITFTLNNLTDAIKHELDTYRYNQYELNKLAREIENCYLMISKNEISNQNKWLRYEQYDLDIISINSSHSNPRSSTLVTKLFWEDDAVGTILKYWSRMHPFQNYTQSRLRHYFDYKHLNLIISEPLEETQERPQIPNPDDDKQNLPFYVWVFTFLGFCSIITIISFMYNNLVPTAWVDNANSVVIVLYAMQVTDLFSDANLVIEMFGQFENAKLNPDNAWKLHLAAFGGLIFLVVPYIVNIICAAGIKSLVDDNQYAKIYFLRMHWFFNVLVAFSGGVYVSLSVVSSRLFGFEFLNSGLTMMELTKLTKVRLYATVMLENVPQLCCIIVYTNYNGGEPSQNTKFSLIMSLLQIVAAILNYIVVHCPQCKADCHIVQYQLEMKVEPRNASDSEVKIELSQDFGNMIRKRKGRKAALRQKLARALECNKNEIEIGYIQVKEGGCIINIVHYLIGRERSLQTIYERQNRMINKEFKSHFGFDDRDVDVMVTYIDKRRTASAVQLYTQVQSTDISANISPSNEVPKCTQRLTAETDEKDEEGDNVCNLSNRRLLNVNSPLNLSFRKTV